MLERRPQLHIVPIAHRPNLAPFTVVIFVYIWILEVCLNQIILSKSHHLFLVHFLLVVLEGDLSLQIAKWYTQFVSRALAALWSSLFLGFSTPVHCFLKGNPNAFCINRDQQNKSLGSSQSMISFCIQGTEEEKTLCKFQIICVYLNIKALVMLGYQIFL